MNPIQTLAANFDHLPPADQSFARSLLLQANDRGLSAKQLFWVEKLNARAAGNTPAEPQLGSFAGVIALFETAKTHLKFPKIRLALPDGRPVVLSLAGAVSRAPGTVNVTDGKAYPANTWYGRVSPDGAWQISKQVDEATQAAIIVLLNQLAADPAGTASVYGKQTGACCFCSRELTDQRSVSVGYGPICAGRFGLPWGETPARTPLACEEV